MKALVKIFMLALIAMVFLLGGQSFGTNYLIYVGDFTPALEQPLKSSNVVDIVYGDNSKSVMNEFLNNQKNNNLPYFTPIAGATVQVVDSEQNQEVFLTNQDGIVAFSSPGGFTGAKATVFKLPKYKSITFDLVIPSEKSGKGFYEWVGIMVGLAQADKSKYIKELKLIPLKISPKRQ